MCCMHICHRAGISPVDALLQHNMEHVESQKKQTLPHIIHYCNYITNNSQIIIIITQNIMKQEVDILIQISMEKC